MGVRKLNPVTPGQRQQVVDDFSDITKEEPEKSLTITLKRTGGRNNQGRITAPHRGGGAKRKYRIIDFKRHDKIGMKAKVLSIEYDPYRSARIALLEYEDGERRYIIAPLGLQVGDEVVAGPDAPIRVGNALPLANIPEGIKIHNIELQPGKGGQIVRAAGSSATILAKEGDYAFVKLPSGEIRKIHLSCYATIGQVSNPDHDSIVLGKAGKMRWLGRRPHTRGVAMNPVDHPLGGGEGRGKGNRPPVSRTGVLAKGGKTRNPRKPSTKFIVQPRTEKKRGR